MDYSGNIASADAIKIVLESNRRMIDRVTETMRIAIAHTNSQSSALIKAVPRELITKNLQPLLSHSTMQAIVKIQSEQIAKISKQIVEINKMSLLTSQSEITIDEPDELIDEEVLVPTAIETKANNFAIWINLVDNHPILAILVADLFYHYVRDPVWNYVDAHYTFPTVLSWLKWLVQFISFP